MRGLIVERVTGRPVGDVIDERIAQPLGLHGTLLPTTPELPEPFAHGYLPTPEASRDVTRQNPAVTWTAGAMVSTLDDLHLWHAPWPAAHCPVLSSRPSD